VRLPLEKWARVGCALALIAGADATAPARPWVADSALRAADDAAVIRVTAVVTDRRGQPLAGLKPADFELLVDGKPQTLDTAELTTVTPTPRAFAFLLDEFHTAAGDSAAVRDGLLRFVDHLRPTDVAYVVKPLDPLTLIKPVPDREALRLAISSFEGRKGDYAPRSTFERNYMAQAPAAVAWARGQIVTSALRAIGQALSQASNVRPAIVLVSDGFERMRTGRDVPANLQTAVRVANRADAPVYAFAPAPPPPAADGTPQPDPGITALRSLATQTGGDLVVGVGAIDSGLASMVRDLDKYYVLTYRAPHGSDGRFHALQVGVKREGVQVRARSGYVAPLSAEMRAAMLPAPIAPARILRRSALIQSWSGMTPTEDGRATVTLTWEPAPARSAAAARARAATIVITASTPKGAVLFDGAIGPAGESGAAGIPNRATFEAPIGPVQVDMKILDAKGVVLDTDSRDVTVPTLRKDSPTIFAPAVIRTRSARDFREAVGSAIAVPVATRDFLRTDRLIIRVPAVDAAGTPVPVTGTLLNRWRQPMREMPALELSPSMPSTTQFDLPLASLAPGEYTIRLTVTHSAGSISEHVTFRVLG
jgi:VWFA-related protein